MGTCLGGSIKAQYFVFAAKQFPFYAYGTALGPAGAALKSNILLLEPAFFHFTLMAAHLGLRGQH